jgi:hypothetical protein
MCVVKVIFYTAIVFFIVVSYRQIFLSTFLHYDESGNYLPAWNYIHHNQYSFTVQNPDTLNSTSAFITIGSYVGYSLTLFSSWIGTEWHLARIWIFLHAVILLRFVYVLVNKHFNKSVALLTCAVLMFNGAFIVYSTRIMGEVPALAGFFLGFWAYTKGIEKKQWFWYILAFAGFQISIFSKEYFAVIIGLTLFVLWIFQEKYRINPVFWIGITLPLVIILWYFFHFRDLETIQLYFAERQIYRTEFFAFKITALQWIFLKPLIWIGYILHSIKCYVQKRHTDIFLWIFQTIYLVLFLISIGFERFGIGLCILSSVYTAEFLYGIHQIPALTKIQKTGIYFLFAILTIQKSPYLLWKKPEKNPILDTHLYQNKIIHTPELSLIPLIVTYSYQLPMYPPAKFKYMNHDKNSVKAIQNQYLNADILILGEYAFTEYSDIYNKKITEYYFQKIQVQDGYQVWVKNSEKKTL